MKRAIVLSGGGARGAYEMGVWKALRYLGIDYDIVTGTSVGSLLGALMVQEDYLKAFKVWYYMDYKKVMDVEINDKYSTKKGKEEILKKYAKKAVVGGYELNGLKKVIDDTLDEEKFLNSKIDYGLVTTYFPSLRGKYVKKESLTKDNIKNYLLASCSCFPAFKPTKIGNNMFIDGGYYDNLPINLAISMGADEVIAVDLGAIGILRKIKKDKVPVKIIKPRNDLGNFLAFEKDYARIAINLGYNDTMKEYNELEGNKYTFKKGSLKRNYERIGNDFFKLYDQYKNKSINKSNNKKLTDKEKNDKLNYVIELLAENFKIDPSEIYRTSFLNVLIKKEFLKCKMKSFYKVKSLIKNNSLKSKHVSKELIYYIYDELDKKRKIETLMHMFPNAFLCAIYLKIITRRT